MINSKKSNDYNFDSLCTTDVLIKKKTFISFCKKNLPILFHIN